MTRSRPATGSDPRFTLSRPVAPWVLAAGLAWLAVDVGTGGPVAAAERRWCRAPGPAPTWARWTSRLAEREAVTAVVVTVATHRICTGRRFWPPVVGVVGGLVVRAGFARVVRRPRPPQEWWRADPHGWSFPSRHTFQALLATTALLDELSPDRPVVGMAGALAATTVVGASRFRLGVHWPSDVLGAALTGVLWLRLLHPARRPCDQGVPQVTAGSCAAPAMRR
jgi:membrane-associated phospholipid phosphatase